MSECNERVAHDTMNPYATIATFLLIILSSLLLAFPSAFLGLILYKSQLFQHPLPQKYYVVLQASVVIYGGGLSFVSTMLSSIPALLSAVLITKHQRRSNIVVSMMFLLLISIIACSVTDIIFIKMESEGSLHDLLKLYDNEQGLQSLYKFVEKNFHLSVSSIGIITGIGIFSPMVKR